MSLKEFTKEVFTRYGLTEDDIKVYIRYLRVPRATMSEVYLSFEEEEIEYAKVEEVTNKLVESKFLLKVDGIVERYIPLEPFFELFTNESGIFRNEIATIKNNVLDDQSVRFEKLESIQNKSIGEIDSAIDAQIKAFFEDSDNKNTNKKENIEKPTDRFRNTSKTLENALHNNIEKDYSELNADLDQLDNELSSITDSHNTSSKELEKNIHNTIDSLNLDLKTISGSFVNDNESEINTAKDNLTKLTAELLGDFGSRVESLEIELKKDLDGHVDRHKNIANELKPKMEQILEKYLERMDKIITDLKERITKLLTEHSSHVKSTTTKVESEIHDKVENRYTIFKDQVNSYKDSALNLLENLLENSNKFSNFAEDISKVGLFFTKGKKTKFIARWKQIEQDISVVSRPFRDNFIKDCNNYIKDTQGTAEELKTEVTDVMSSENGSLATETTDLDRRAQETISAELDTLATDMAGEIEGTLQTGVKDCSDTTIKLKDSLEQSISTHRKQYGDELNRHRDNSLRHYADFDMEIKRKNENWIKDVDIKFTGVKRDSSTETDNQMNKVNNYRTDYKKIVDDRKEKIRTDFNNSRSLSSEKIDSEIELWEGESNGLDKLLAEMLEDHKIKYKENAATLQNSLSNTTRDTIQNVKDAIADFTLNIMNSIDDSTELAENNEGKLKDIQNASSLIPEIASVSSWHTIGKDALIACIKDAIYRVKSSIIIVMPYVVPEILQFISEFAYQKKAVRFMLTSKFDMNTYANIIKKMMQLGNIQFRNLSQQGDYFAVTRDAEEVIICPATKKDSEMISIISNHELICKLYSSFIGPIFQANSRPIRL